jgi:ATP-dependent RNA helicase RhlE
LAKAGILADSIHGDKSQLERLKALEAFKDGSVKVLVATDVAARGLDIDELPHVINFELPHTPEDYVHRIGRTGRAGKKGTAVSLVSAHEVPYLVDIEKLIKISVEQIVIAGFEPEYDYEYPPTGKKKPHRRPEPAAPAAAPRREPSPPREPRQHGKRKSQIAADGFDFSAPYMAKELEPRGEIPADDHAPVKPDPHKPKRPVAALLGGLGKRH